MAVPLHHHVDLLRFNTCGSVDDGKSTLIGRLLYDSKSVMEDQLAALERSADITGHVQYTRNMVTGASSANLSVILVDARLGVIEQSRRHACIASLLRIPHLVVVVNKMDLAGWSEERFVEIRGQFEEFLPRLDMKDVKFIPASALHGDNVVNSSRNTPWYPGPTLLGHLEGVHIGS